MTINGCDYIEGLDRNDMHTVVSHLYKGDYDGEMIPMCLRGWNRSDGEGFSIFRNNTSDKGTCKICLRRAKAGLPPVESRTRITKYL